MACNACCGYGQNKVIFQIEDHIKRVFNTTGKVHRRANCHAAMALDGKYNPKLIKYTELKCIEFKYKGRQYESLFCIQTS